MNNVYGCLCGYSGLSAALQNVSHIIVPNVLVVCVVTVGCLQL